MHLQDVFNETRSILEPAGAVAVAGAKAYLKHYNLKVSRTIPWCEVIKLGDPVPAGLIFMWDDSAKVLAVLSVFVQRVTATAIYGWACDVYRNLVPLMQ